MVDQMYVRVIQGQPNQVYIDSSTPIFSAVTTSGVKLFVKAARPVDTNMSVKLKIRYATNSTYLSACTGDCVETSPVTVTYDDDWATRFSLTSLTAGATYYFNFYASGDGGTTYTSRYDLAGQYASVKIDDTTGISIF